MQIFKGNYYSRKSRINRFSRIPNDLVHIPEQLTDNDEIAVYKSGWRACERGAYRSSPHTHQTYNYLWLLGYDNRIDFEESLRVPHNMDPEELYQNPPHIPDGCVITDIGLTYTDPYNFVELRNVYYDGPDQTGSIRITQDHELWNWPDVL